MSKIEELNKSLDALIDEVFTDESVEKSIDIAKDAETTADSAVNKAPKAQNDEKRNAGRPKQISDVPEVDEDKKRAKNYDSDITENENKEMQPEETKQAKDMTQIEEKNRIGDKPKAPKIRPFVKSENGNVEISEEDYKAFQEFKKSQEEVKQEELKKAKLQEQEDLIKSAVSKAISGLKEENESLKKSLNETQELMKSIASTPQERKSIVTGMEVLEKSQDPANKEPEVFTKSQMLKAAEDLVIKGMIPAEVAMELDTTSTVYNKEYRALIEAELNKN